MAKKRLQKGDDREKKVWYNCIVKKCANTGKTVFGEGDPTPEAVFFRFVKKGVFVMFHHFPFPIGALLATENMWDRFSTVMKDFYGHLIGISTIVAVTMAAVALIVRMVSRNQRAVDEATAWLKRIVITWIILNSLGFVVAYLQPLITGGNYVW